LRIKSFLAIALGLVALGIAAWRVSSDGIMAGVVVGLIGILLLIRGLTNTVRAGL
jgi:hypothetical protein